jgi:hypothetical protein
MPTSLCPHCGLVYDGSSSDMSPEPPKSGDIGICTGCFSVNRFDRKLRLRAATADELREIECNQPGLLAQVARYRLAAALTSVATGEPAPEQREGTA